MLTPESSAGTWMVWTVFSFPSVNAGIAAANKAKALQNLTIVDRFEVGLSPAKELMKWLFVEYKMQFYGFLENVLSVKILSRFTKNSHQPRFVLNSRRA